MSGNGKRPLVPPLRFPEFKDAPQWSFEPLSRLAKRSTRKNGGRQHVRVLTNSAEHGVVDQRDYFDKDIANQENLEGYYIVEKGDYIYNPRISARAPVGPISRNNIGAGIMSPLYTVFGFDSLKNDFYTQYFKSTHWHRYLRQISSTGARHDRMSITSDGFMGLPLPVTSPAEQQKINDCLSSLDERIAAEQSKLDTLVANKKSLTYQLFPAENKLLPRLRFPKFRQAPEWTPSKLSDISLIQSGGTPARTNAEYWGGTIPWITTSLIDFNVISQAEEYITALGLRESSAKIFPKGTILMAMYGQGKTRGKVAVLGIDAATNQACAALLLNQKVEAGFVFQSLAASYEKIRRISNSGGQENLSAGLIADISFCYPQNKEEQKQIADFLFGMDEVIDAQADRVSVLIRHKRGLLQQLFPAFDAEPT